MTITPALAANAGIRSINGLRREMGESLAPCVEEAKSYVQQQAV